MSFLNKYNPQNNMQQARKSIEELQRENDKMRQDYINMYKQLQSQAQALREANEYTSERSR